VPIEEEKDEETVDWIDKRVNEASLSLGRQEDASIGSTSVDWIDTKERTVDRIDTERRRPLIGSTKTV